MAFFRVSLLLVVLLVTCGFALRPAEQPVPTRPPTPRPSSAKPSPKRPPTLYDRYVTRAAKAGLTVHRPTVLGLRGVAPDGRRHPQADNASDYDDTFVVLLPETRTVKRFRGATHAGQYSSTLAPNGVAQLRPGLYRASPCGEYADMPCWLVTTPAGNEAVPAWRDADRDGVISKDEKLKPQTATEILFHSGRYDDHPSSIGCQTLPPLAMQQFIATLGAPTEFDFLLLETTEL